MDDDAGSTAGYAFNDNGNKYEQTLQDEYGYDLNGNMTRDDNKGITVTYNALNLPTNVDFGITGMPGSSSGNKIEWKLKSRMISSRFARRDAGRGYRE